MKGRRERSRRPCVIGDECLEYYEGGIWLKDIYFVRGENAHGKPPGFTYYE